MRNGKYLHPKALILVALLAIGSGCQAFTPGAAQRGVATLNVDVHELRDVIARLTTDVRVLRTLDAVAANVSAVDALLNK